MKEKYYNTEQEKVYHLQLLKAIELLKECSEEYSDHSLKNKVDKFLTKIKQ